jgi:hypothetical protein
MKDQKIGGYRVSQIANFTPEQMELLQRMMEQIGPESFMARLAEGDPTLFEEMEAPSKRQFAEAQGNIGSRFSGMGMGAQKSSGFQNTMNQAASDFAQKLQGDRLGYQTNAIKDMQSMANSLMQQKPYENVVRERKHHGPNAKKTDWGGLIGAGVGGVGGFMLGGPMGAATGASMGYGVGSGKGGGGGGFQSTPGWDFNQWAINRLPGGV